jgi:hypothetical protein
VLAYGRGEDGYQDLDLLDAAAAQLPALPVVVATRAREASRWRHLRVARCEDPAERAR